MPPEGNSYNTTTTYNADADQSSVTNANGVTATYTYDGSERVNEITYSDGTPTVTYSYNPDGTTSQMTDGSGTTTYGYDSPGEPGLGDRRRRRYLEVHLGR